MKILNDALTNDPVAVEIDGETYGIDTITRYPDEFHPDTLMEVLGELTADIEMLTEVVRNLHTKLWEMRNDYKRNHYEDKSVQSRIK